jgi:hypothetical protein
MLLDSYDVYRLLLEFSPNFEFAVPIDKTELCTGALEAGSWKCSKQQDYESLVTTIEPWPPYSTTS